MAVQVFQGRSGFCKSVQSHLGSSGVVWGIQDSAGTFRAVRVIWGRSDLFRAIQGCSGCSGLPGAARCHSRTFRAVDDVLEDAHIDAI